MSKVRKTFLFGLVFLLAASFVLLAATFMMNDTKVHALDYDETKAETTIKVEFYIPEEAQVGGSLPAGTVINRGISFFNWIGDGNQGLKPGYKLAYDVYSPTPIPGLGFFGGAEQGGEWRSWDLRFTEEVDQNGISAQSHADMTDYIGNGWYSREIEFGQFLTVDNGGLASSHWVTMLEAKSPIPYEKLTVYIKNARILDENGGIVNYCFFKGTTDTAYSISIYNFPTKLSECADPEDNYMYAPPEGDPATSIVTEGTEENVRRIKTTAEYVENVAPATLSFPSPVQGINRDLNLSEITDLDGATLTEAKVYTLGENDVIGEEIAVNNFVVNFSAMGKYRVELKAMKGDLETNAVLYLWTVDPAVPFIFEADTDVIARLYEDKSEITLPAISAYYKDQRFPITPVVTFNDTNVAVTSVESGFTFTPADYGDYVVQYTYTDPDNAEKTVSAAPVTIRVGVMNIDISGLELAEKEDGTLYGVGEIGTAYDLSKVVFTDPVNGVTEYTVKISKGGVPVTEGLTGTSSADYAFLTDVPGEYTMKFSAVNFMGETIPQELTLNISAIEGMVTKLKLYVPEELREEGIRKTAEIRVFTWLEGPAIGARDTINYSIYMPDPIPGVGMIDFLGDGNGVAGWGKFSATGSGLTGNEKDVEGIPFTATADLTEKLQDADGNSGWYARSVPVPTCYTGVGAMCDMVLYVDTTAAVGEYIEVYLRDIYFESDDGIVNVYYNGMQTTQAPSIFAANNPPTPGGYALATSLDGTQNNAIKVEISVPETHRAADTAKELTIRLFGWQQKAIPGKGTFSFDIKMDSPIAGVGYANAYGDNTSSIGWNALLTGSETDTDGVALATDADLSDKLSDWYTREIPYDSGSATQGIADIFIVVKTSAAVGEKITIYLDNIKFIAEDDTATVYFAGGSTEPALSSSITASNIDASSLPEPDNYAVEGAAYYADGPMLYKRALPENNEIECSQPYTFSDNLAYDYNDREFVDYTLSIIGPDYNAVEVNGKTFTPTKRGNYMVTITASNENGTLKQMFTITAIDDVAPVIGEMTLPKDATVGKGVTLTPPPVTDNASAAEDIIVRLTVLDPDNNTVTLEDNKFTPKKAGEYTIKVIAIDEANNASNGEFKLTVAEKSTSGGDGGSDTQKGGGCSGVVGLNAVLVLSLVCVAAFVVVIGKKTIKNK